MEEKGIDTVLNLLRGLITSSEKSITEEEKKVGFKTFAIMEKINILQRHKQRLRTYEKYVEINKKLGEQNVDHMVRLLLASKFISELGKGENDKTWSDFFNELNSYLEQLSLEDFKDIMVAIKKSGIRPT